MFGDGFVFVEGAGTFGEGDFEGDVVGNLAVVECEGVGNGVCGNVGEGEGPGGEGGEKMVKGVTEPLGSTVVSGVWLGNFCEGGKCLFPFVVGGVVYGSCIVVLC